MTVNLTTVETALANLRTDAENGSALYQAAPGNVTLRNGDVVKNLRQRLLEMGLNDPVAFATGLSVSDTSFSVTYSGRTYRAALDAVPFTTTATFDPTQWTRPLFVTESEDARDAAEASAAAAAADLVETEADTVATAADAVATAADAVATAADRVQTGLDRVQTVADRVQTGLDRTAVASDRTAVATDLASTVAAKDAALLAFANFEDTYLGPSATEPTLDLDGSALEAGDLFYDTANNVMKVYTGSAWAAAYVSATGVALVANNLSDLNSAATALTNLGLTATAAELNFVDGVTSGVQAQLDAKSALASPAFTGTPTAPTQAPGDNSTKLATTAFVAAAGAFTIGDTITSARALASPEWLPSDGAVYLQSSYPALFAELGTIGDFNPGLKLDNPATLPAGNSYGTAFSADGTYLSVAHATSPFVTIYKSTNYDTSTSFAVTASPEETPPLKTFIKAT